MSQKDDQRAKPSRNVQTTIDAARHFADDLHSQTTVSGQMNRAETVSGRWLVKAILITLLVAWAGVYVAFCLLFYQGQWQFVFAPPNLAHTRAANEDWLSGSWARRRGPISNSHYTPPNAAKIAASTGLPISDERFDSTQSGVKLLDGWWIPAATTSGSQSSAASQPVVLFCSNGHTDLAGNVAVFRALHSLGVSVFAFDYRGFGASQSGHPSQDKAYHDGASALQHVVRVHRIAANRIVIYGAELGAAVAAHVATQSPGIGGLILEDPQPSLLRQVEHEQRIHVLPMWLIFQQRFDIARILPQLLMPKLIVSTPSRAGYESGTAAVFQQAAPPKQIVHIQPTTAPSLYDEPAWSSSVGAFLTALSARTARQHGS